MVGLHLTAVAHPYAKFHLENECTFQVKRNRIAKFTFFLCSHRKSWHSFLNCVRFLFVYHSSRFISQNSFVWCNLRFTWRSVASQSWCEREGERERESASERRNKENNWNEMQTNNRSTCAASIVISIYVFGRCAHYGAKPKWECLFIKMIATEPNTLQTTIHLRLVTSQRNEYEMHTNTLSALNSITVGAAAAAPSCCAAAQLLQL